MSPVFGRESGYTFKIFSNEEERMHIHVVYERNTRLSFGLSLGLNWQRTLAFLNMS